MGKNAIILAGDIGASKTILALYPGKGEFSSPLKESTYPSGEYDGLSPMLDDFLLGVDRSIASAAFGVAGPVVDQKAQITKLPWSIEADAIKNHLNISAVFLLNDLVANAYGLDCIEPAGLVSLNDSCVNLNSPKAMLSPGTGLGEVFFIDSVQGKQVFDSEGGHCLFAPANQEQIGLLQFYQKDQQTITYDTLCCGDGFVKIYNFLREQSTYSANPEIETALSMARHPAAVITENSVREEVQQRCPLCVRTVEIFVEMLAAEAANMVLKMLARGGVYIGGGIPPKILPYLQKSFMPVFSRHQTMGRILSTVPVHVVCNTKTALYGAASFAMGKVNIKGV
nr:glucokinase [Desulfobulbaceae bacterium]